MITLSIKNLKTKKVAVEVLSLDKAKERLNYVKAHPTKEVLEGASYEEDEEKKLLSKYLDLGSR